MNTKILDGVTLRRMLVGGANGIRSQIDVINELNVFPVPDGDTGTNMTRTVESGVAKVNSDDAENVGEIAGCFARGTLLGARGNSGVILSQFIKGVSDSLQDKTTATVREVSEAIALGVKRAYSAVARPVEGTMLTVFRESSAYAADKITDDTTLEEFLRLTLDEATRSLDRTKEMLPVLTEADVVDSGGAGYLSILRGMYECLTGKSVDTVSVAARETSSAPEVNYDLFTTDSVAEWGYCTECLVRIQRAKIEPEKLDISSLTAQLEAMGADSIVILRDGDVLKLHAHIKTPSMILDTCQRYGEFLNVKIENMSLQHSEKLAEEKKQKQKKHKRYGIVTVATGEGFKALLTGLGADVIIDGGQTGNPSTEDFIKAFESLDVDDVIVLPNNGNILLTAKQAAELYDEARVSVLPTKTIPEGYSALAVFNSSEEDLDSQLSDMTEAKAAVATVELTRAIRDASIGGVHAHEGEVIGVLNGELVSSENDFLSAMVKAISTLDDLDMRELITLFVGEGVTDDERIAMQQGLEDAFPDMSVDVLIGDQKIYNYLASIE